MTMRHATPSPVELTCTQSGSAGELSALWGSTFTSERKELVNIFLSLPLYDGLP